MCEGKVFQYERDKISGRERINEGLCATPQGFPPYKASFVREG